MSAVYSDLTYRFWTSQAPKRKKRRRLVAVTEDITLNDADDNNSDDAEGDEEFEDGEIAQIFLSTSGPHKEAPSDGEQVLS